MQITGREPAQQLLDSIGHRPLVRGERAAMFRGLAQQHNGARDRIAGRFIARPGVTTGLCDTTRN